MQNKEPIFSEQGSSNEKNFVAENIHKNTSSEKLVSTGQKVAEFIFGALIGIALLFFSIVFFSIFSFGSILFSFLCYVFLLVVLLLRFSRLGRKYVIWGVVVVSSIPLFVWGSCAGLIR